MDMEAYEAARELGKDVHFLETIKEQVHAMEGIPLEKIATFLKRMDTWEHYARRHSKYYLAGDHDPILGIVTEYPTRCESIIDKRDPVIVRADEALYGKGRHHSLCWHHAHRRHHEDAQRMRVCNLKIRKMITANEL